MYSWTNVYLGQESKINVYLGLLVLVKSPKINVYLGHVSKITGKASRALNVLKSNLSNCSTQVKAAAYLAMVRPQLEYASVVWDPIYNSDVQKLENIQRRAARWVLKDYIQ